MSKSNKLWIFGNAIFIMFVILSFFVMNIYVTNVNDSGFSYRMGERVTNCSLSVNVEKFWSEESHGYTYGVQYALTAANLTSVDLRDWVAKVKVPENCKLADFWNGEFVMDNGIITITPVEYNKVIEVGSDRTLGCIIYTNNKDCIEDFTIQFYKLVAVRDLKFYSIILLLSALVIIADIVYGVSEFKTRSINRKKQEYKNIVEETFLTFANIIDAKDSYTNGHSLRVAIYSRELAKRLGMNEEEQEHIYFVALLHDIGKIGTPDAILKKKGKLDDREREEIQKHVMVGGEILKDFRAIEGIEDGARYHHERYDGTGYARGLKGEEIPLIGRIICVADAFDAMTSTRCYRPSLTIETVIEELKRCSGTQFDPKIVPLMLEMIDSGVAPIENVN